MIDVDFCPYSKSTKIDAEWVDIGVGWQRVTPYHCFPCDAREFYSAEDAECASPEECSVGWFRGQIPFSETEH